MSPSCTVRTRPTRVAISSSPTGRSAPPACTCRDLARLWWNFGDNIPLDNQRALLRHAFDRGITHFDLANNYGPPYGSAEKNFGRIFAEDFRRTATS